MSVPGQLHRQPESGLTLVEVLVVLAIIGIVSAAAVPALFPSGGQRVARDAAQLLAGRMNLVMDAALTGQGNWRMEWWETGYAFRRIDGAEPRASSAVQPNRHDLPSGLVLVGAAASPVALLADGLGQPAQFQLRASSGPVAQVEFDGLTARVTSGGTP